MSDNFSDTAHWRDSSRMARFFVVDARAAFPIFLFLMHIKWWTAMLAVVSLVFFGFIEHYGFSVPIFMRWIRSTLAGPRKNCEPWWKT
jgi:intracellular multiplication protein IcmT